MKYLVKVLITSISIQKEWVHLGDGNVVPPGIYGSPEGGSGLGLVIYSDITAARRKV